MAKRNLAELKIPAASSFIPVAKRVATTLGGQLGLSQAEAAPDRPETVSKTLTGRFRVVA